jgi:hypothetical protein
MLELTGMGSVLRAIGWLYWLLAIGAISLALIKGRTPRAKAQWTAIAVVVSGFLPGKAMVEQYQRDAYAKEAWAYFKKKCDTEAGEKIYKTYTGVKSVLVVTPLPPATDKDHFDQFWYGDPYSSPAHSQRGKLEAITLASMTAPVSYGVHGHGYDYVEMRDAPTSPVVRYYYSQGATHYQTSTGQAVESRFGISWEDISTPHDRKFWVAGSRLRVIDLTDSSIVAERVGFFIEAGFGSTAGQRRPWLTSRGPNTTCPSIRNGSYEDRWFILKALSPTAEKQNGK